jgi:hypothetical protein
MTELPNKLSALLRLAVADAQKCEAMPDVYTLDMLVWHAPKNDRCAVCMAGAVIAQTLGVRPDQEREPGLDFEDHTENALDAINSMRGGYFRIAAEVLSVDMANGAGAALDDAATVVRKAYVDGDRIAPWSTYLRAAEILEAAGL